MHLFETMSVEDVAWVVGPFLIALLASLVARRAGPRALWYVVVPPYALAGGVYSWQGYAAVRQGFTYVDGYPLAVVWNAAGAALFLGTVGHVAVLRRWSVGWSAILSGLAGLVPAVVGIMGAGIVFGCAGALLTIAAHLATRASRSSRPAA